MYSNHYCLMAVNTHRVLADREKKHKEYQEEIKSLRVNIYETEENSYLQSLYTQREPTLQLEMEMQILESKSETHRYRCGKQKYDYVNSLKQYLEDRLMTLKEGLDREQVERVKLVIDLFKTLEKDDIRTELELLEESKINHLKGFQTQTMYNLLVKRRSELTELALVALNTSPIIGDTSSTDTELTTPWIDGQTSIEIKALKNLHEAIVFKCSRSLNKNETLEHSKRLITYLEERGNRRGLDEKQIERANIVTELLGKIQRNDVRGELMLLQEEAIKPLKGMRTQRLYDILVERRNFLLESAVNVLEAGIKNEAPRASCSSSSSCS